MLKKNRLNEYFFFCCLDKDHAEISKAYNQLTDKLGKYSNDYIIVWREFPVPKFVALDNLPFDFIRQVSDDTLQWKPFVEYPLKGRHSLL
jgi:hypothetical protein